MSRFIVLAAIGFVSSLSAQAELPALKLESQITVSGISSGGYMATQFHLAHSSLVDGAAIVAAGPWYCAQNDLGQALQSCVDKAEPAVDLAVLQSKAEALAKAGKIDALTGLRGDRVWLLHGSLDTKVSARVSDQLHAQYAAWVDATDLIYLNDKAFHHTLPTVAAGSDCDKSEAPYLGRCNYDAAGAMLTHLLGELKAPKDDVSGELHSFDQQELGGESAGGLADEGFIYIPAQCAKGESCQLHVSFHGCQQNADAIGDAYAREAGFNRWADANNLVVLYPQTRKSLFAPLNPKACWDWWGYTGADYTSKDGAQIKAVKTMIEQLSL
ncbi:PHB depolymerase family esterase [Simiduia curdlanivorans]|uniref:PHB depolymerase family esterase n=1 Tax=Simiduia curdlanivorans TaxID=1492769 RepID=A0ABV8V290_9GAMM|nr:PHB depolymerase family esterase [Simiduia curdlanivorans]MDN3637641.1 PHB depolymerase family esterase [Simiduia curdlanivorans]